LPIVFIAIELIISEPTHALGLYEFIVVNGQTTTNAFHNVM